MNISWLEKYTNEVNPELLFRTLCLCTSDDILHADEHYYQHTMEHPNTLY